MYFNRRPSVDTEKPTNVVNDHFFFFTKRLPRKESKKKKKKGRKEEITWIIGSCRTNSRSQDKLESVISRLGKGRQGQQQQGMARSINGGAFVTFLKPTQTNSRYSRNKAIARNIWITASDSNWVLERMEKSSPKYKIKALIILNFVCIFYAEENIENLDFLFLRNEK